MTHGLTKQFKYEDIIGVLQRFNPNRGAFDKALYLSALGNIYPHVRIDLRGSTVDEVTDNLNAGMTIGQLSGLGIWAQLDHFTDLAVRVREMHGLGFEWPTAKAAPEHIDQAFQHFLDRPEFWKSIETESELLDNPNGKVGAPAETLTDEERLDPN